MSRFRLSRRAEADIVEARRYIASDNPAAADQFVGDLFDLFHTLGRDPKIGQQRTDLRPNLRSFSLGNYVVFYQLIGELTEIVAIVHGARDIEGLFHRGDI
jgi:toxin ParE1/3/4